MEIEEKDTNGDSGAAGDVRRLEEELRQKENLYLRALADFDNYRKRVEKIGRAHV